MKKNKVKEENIKKEKNKNENNNKVKECMKMIKFNKFVNILKRRWLVNTTNTIILIAIIVAVFIVINVLLQNANFTPIDFSQEKLYTLTEDSKETVKNIEEEVNIYFVGYIEEDYIVTLAKQYNNVNDKITIQIVQPSDRPDLVQKYGIENDTRVIIIECGEKSKVLTDNDLVTYDTNTYETISIAEEKITTSILFVISKKVPKVYFLNGYSDYILDRNMNLLKMYLSDIYLVKEVIEVDTIDILSVGKIPDDCDTLVITTPSKDFDDVAFRTITDYINSGRNILWLNAAQTVNKDLPNVNKVLELYGVKPFEVGVIRETDSKRMALNSQDLIMPEISYSKYTESFYDVGKIVLANATKINIDNDKLSEINVKSTEVLSTSSKSYFRTNFEIESSYPTDDEEEGSFIVGVELDKTLKEKNEETGEEEVISKLIIIGENYFATDYPFSSSSQYAAIQLSYNSELVLNSIVYLVDKEEDIIARKSTGTVAYTATQEQDTIIRSIIFIFPIAIVITGVVIWQVRRSKK